VRGLTHHAVPCQRPLSDQRVAAWTTAVNQFGSSNWATVTIEFERVDSADGMLQFCFVIFGGMMLATFLGMARVICLQAILNPDHSCAGPMHNCVCLRLASAAQFLPFAMHFVTLFVANRYPIIGKFCAGFCAPPPEEGEGGLTADDVRHDFMLADEDNPIFEIEVENPAAKESEFAPSADSPLGGGNPDVSYET
jgi:hypothetical protein